MSKRTQHSKNKPVWQDPHAQREAEKYDNPVPSRELILAQLDKTEHPLTHPDLVEQFHLHDEDQIEALRRRLIAMCRDGQLMENRKGAFIPMHRIELVRGRVQGHKDGFGFLIPEDGSEDLMLGPRQMRKVFDGDKVAVRVAGTDNRGKRDAVIVEIIQRNTTQVVGRFYMQGDSGYVVPDNRRMTHEILIHASDMSDATHGQFVVAEITQQPDSRQMPLGRITEVLGDHLAPGMEIDIALRSYEIPFKWSQAVEQQTATLADEVTEQDKQNRIDIRHLPLVTIDGEDAKDFDDAVYCEYNKKTKGWRLYVAIADVSHYVGVNTPLDVEAQNRGNSVYFPEFVVPMLPEKLSNGLCSLKPNVDRLCMVCEMTISASGNLSGYKFYEAVMHSHARLTYNLVGKILQGDEDEQASLRAQYAELVPHLDALHGLYKCLRESRTQRGAIDFETTETRIIFNAERKIEDIVPVHRNDAHKLIEECMLCANVATARFFQKYNQPALYRVHQGPTEQKLENLRAYLTEQGLHLGGGKDPHPTDYLHVMEQIDGRPDAHLIQTMLLRSMSQAVYQPDNEGHFGLAYPAYTHFTSPIRRYPDLLVHRGIRRILRSDRPEHLENRNVERAAGAKTLKADAIYPYDMAALLQLGEQCSMTERRADDATRDVMDFLKCEYMRSHVGEEFDGIVNSVTNFGLFVQLKDLYIEGLIHVTNLGNDFYVFDPVRHRLKGERSGVSFSMGDEIRVIVTRVDLDDRKIDFELLEKTASARRNKGKRPAAERSAGRGTSYGGQSAAQRRDRKKGLQSDFNRDGDIKPATGVRKRKPVTKAEFDEQMKRDLGEESASGKKKPKKKLSKRQKLNKASAKSKTQKKSKKK